MTTVDRLDRYSNDTALAYHVTGSFTLSGSRRDLAEVLSIYIERSPERQRSYSARKVFGEKVRERTYS